MNANRPAIGARAADDSFPVRIAVHTDDRPGMLNQLTSAMRRISGVRDVERLPH